MITLLISEERDKEKYYDQLSKMESKCNLRIFLKRIDNALGINSEDGKIFISIVDREIKNILIEMIKLSALDPVTLIKDIVEYFFNKELDQETIKGIIHQMYDDNDKH
jgi:hypothetical protein